MSTAVYNVEDVSLRRPFLFSVTLHVGLSIALLVGIWVQRSAIPWGGVGGQDAGIKVSLVGGAGIPMPQPEAEAKSDVVDPTKGKYKEEPKPKEKPPEPKTDAVKIPKFDKNKPQPVSRPSKTFENKEPPPENAIPYGKGGALNVPVGSATSTGPGSGLTVQGAGGGDFAARYPWYVDGVRKRIYDNWNQNAIDAALRSSRRGHAVVTFTILRDGTIKNIRIEQSSGNRSLDDSGMRALLSIDRMPVLPSDWRGSSVDVIFDFDLSKTH